MTSPTGWSPYEDTTQSSNNLIDSLLYGTNWVSSSITYSFPTTGSVWSTSPSSGYGPKNGGGEPWSDRYNTSSTSDRTYTKQILQSWANVANITFAEVADNSTTVGDFRFAYTYLASHDAAVAWVADFPGPFASAGDIWYNAEGSSAVSVFKQGSFAGFTVLHELGHALGLKHPFQASSTVSSILPDQWDSQSYSVMSYSSSTNSLAKNSSYYPTTPMLLDIQAIQYIYGANYNYNSGNTTYTYSDFNDYRETIWDGGGTDNINYVGSYRAFIDLRPGYGSQMGNDIDIYSDTGAIISTVKNVWIAYDVTIENANGGNGNDTITGNDANNNLNGGGGNDTLYGGAGDDTFDWESSLRGGADMFYGGSGNDSYVIDSLFESAVEYSGEGFDTVYVTFSYSLSNYPNIENLRAFGATAVSLTGNAADNILAGSSGNDTLNGGSGFDTADFRSNRANYTVSKVGSTVSVKTITGTDGIDTLTNIEYLKFTDQPVVIAPANTSNQYAALLYQGALGRTPDPTGLAYWVKLAENLSSATKALGLYGLSDATGNFNGNLSIAGGFTQSAEFINNYGSLTNNQFVTQLYANVLDRSPDPSGLSDWVGQLSRGTTREHVLIGFAESVEAIANATVGFVGIHGHHDAWLILS